MRPRLGQTAGLAERFLVLNGLRLATRAEERDPLPSGGPAANERIGVPQRRHGLPRRP